jgi:hypothetical protein
MTQWLLWQWLLWLMVAVAMAVVGVNCAEGVDADATILSSVSMALAKTPSPPLPLIATSINDDCYCHH